MELKKYLFLGICQVLGCRGINKMSLQFLAYKKNIDEDFSGGRGVKIHLPMQRTWVYLWSRKIPHVHRPRARAPQQEKPSQ